MQDFFPSMALKPNPACEEVVCHQRQREYQVLIFFCMKNLTPRRLNFWRLLLSNSRPFGSKLCWNAPPKCQMWSSARGLPRKGMLKLRSDRRFFELFLTVLELLLLHCIYSHKLQVFDVCEGAAIHASTITYEIWSGVLNFAGIRRS